MNHRTSAEKLCVETDCLLCKILTLIKFLRDGINTIWFEETSSISTGRSEPVNQLMKERMLRSGWCPYLAELWSKQLDMAHLHYLGGVGYPNPMALRSGDSVACSTSACTCNNVDLNNYKTSHASFCRPAACLATEVQTHFIEQIIKKRRDSTHKAQEKASPTSRFRFKQERRE